MYKPKIMSTAMRKPTLLEALIPIIFLISLLAMNVYVFSNEATSGSNQIVLLLAGAVAGLVAVIRLGLGFETITHGILRSITSSMEAMLILLLIGALSGTWLLSGIVPAMIYHGLNLLNPTIFLVAACVICCIVSLATGSSWSTVATVGVALLGIGKTLGIDEGVVAGAIISGAYFGDKMSPLSDTTNLAPAMAGTDLFTHIRYMILTTAPTITITLIIFLIWGFTTEVAQSADISIVQNAIAKEFNISLWLFLVPAAVIIMIIRKVPALPALFAGGLLGGLAAVIFQPEIVAKIANIEGSTAKIYYMGVMKAMYGQIKVTTDNAMVNELLTTKGMGGMLNTIWLIICAMVFGGIMEVSGMLERITQSVISSVHSAGGLIASAAGTCIFFNITASDQYLAIVVPGRMYAKTFKDRGLSPENLSRTLEDSGTVTSVLVPWNTCGATQASVLGVATLTYAPYCFFNILSPLMTILFGVLNIKIRRIKNEKIEEVATVEA
jgi:Na+:H+ antiporter, NhaC family